MRISGYPIVFGARSVDLGGFIEVVRPEAVDRTMRTGDDVVALFNHNDDAPLGRRSARTLVLEKDTRGLRIDLDVDEHVSFAADLVRIISRGDAPGGSFGFRALDDIWSMVDGSPFREVLDMIVREISVGVSFPAYKQTALSVGYRSQTPAKTGGRSVVLCEKELKLVRAMSR
jgi:uncharacterized protein